MATSHRYPQLQNNAHVWDASTFSGDHDRTRFQISSNGAVYMNAHRCLPPRIRYTSFYDPFSKSTFLVNMSVCTAYRYSLKRVPAVYVYAGADQALRLAICELELHGNPLIVFHAEVVTFAFGQGCSPDALADNVVQFVEHLAIKIIIPTHKLYHACLSKLLISRQQLW